MSRSGAEAACREVAVERLIGVLEHELVLLRRLGDLLGAQTGAIVSGDTTQLAQLQAEAEKVTAQLDEADQSRRNLAPIEAEDGGQPVALSQLAGRVPARQAVRLERVRRRLLDAHTRAERARQTNQRLLQTALELTQTTLRAVVAAVTQPATYGAGGGAASGQAPNLLVDEDA